MWQLREKVLKSLLIDSDSQKYERVYPTVGGLAAVETQSTEPSVGHLNSYTVSEEVVEDN